MKQYIAVFYCNKYQKCGFNDRMIPQAVQYLKHQKPTRKMNSVIYDKPCYGKTSSAAWWSYLMSPASMINTEKIDLLKHLINKLK